MKKYFVLFVILLNIIACKKVEFSKKIALSSSIGFEDETLGFIINNNTVWEAFGKSENNFGFFGSTIYAGNSVSIYNDSIIYIESTNDRSTNDSPFFNIQFSISGFPLNNVNNLNLSNAKINVNYNNVDYNIVESGSFNYNYGNKKIYGNFNFVLKSTDNQKIEITNGIYNLNTK